MPRPALVCRTKVDIHTVRKRLSQMEADRHGFVGLAVALVVAAAMVAVIFLQSDVGRAHSVEFALQRAVARARTRRTRTCRRRQRPCNGRSLPTSSYTTSRTASPHTTARRATEQSEGRRPVTAQRSRETVHRCCQAAELL